MAVKIEVDEEQLATAKEFAGIADDDAVVRAALAAFIEREAARSLARMGGTEPQLKPIRRRRAIVR